MTSSHYLNTTKDFLSEHTDKIVGKLTTAAGKSGFYQQKHQQTLSWNLEIDVLKKNLSRISEASRWWLLLEYPIPRRGKRIDAILLANDLVFVIEFKCGSDNYFKEDLIQVEDYSLDIRDFHSLSHSSKIIPLLVSTEAPNVKNKIVFEDNVSSTQRLNKDNLYEALVQIIERYSDKSKQTNGRDWNSADYDPTPTIIEGAQALYSGQNVREISQSHARKKNLTSTANAVFSSIKEARDKNKKIICFITGVPGAGKTLAGLNIVHNRALHEGNLGVFLSGNGPLVKILTEALARDNSKQNNIKINESRRKVSTFVNNVHRFIDAYYLDKSKKPKDKIIIFDEAQRAWNLQQSQRKFKRNHSEPESLIEIMNRHSDWAVIVALIGGGQEINTGEAGLSEWGRVIKERFSDWKVYISPQLSYGSGVDATDPLFVSKPEGLDITEVSELHLDVSIRSFRAEKLANFVDTLLNCNSHDAHEILEKELQSYPLFMTRDLDTAKKWLKDKQRGNRRIGLIASSGARRLKAYGLNVNQDSKVEEWFLNSSEDVRSSYYLEDPATEFEIQGLEIDWSCVCWGADFRVSNKGITYRKFRGTNWQNVNDEDMKKFIKNKYRVLLTRAREGFIIWVPKGDIKDKTRLPEFYDVSAEYLKSCGIKEI